jgi:glucosamine 6-phosphate synthetase-like amidotransferase/phosphosugar isomerase protein
MSMSKENVEVSALKIMHENIKRIEKMVMIIALQGLAYCVANSNDKS